MNLCMCTLSRVCILEYAFTGGDSSYTYMYEVLHRSTVVDRSPSEMLCAIACKEKYVETYTAASTIIFTATALFITT